MSGWIFRRLLCRTVRLSSDEENSNRINSFSQQNFFRGDHQVPPVGLVRKRPKKIVKKNSNERRQAKWWKRRFPIHGSGSWPLSGIGRSHAAEAAKEMNKKIRERERGMMMMEQYSTRSKRRPAASKWRHRHFPITRHWQRERRKNLNDFPLFFLFSFVEDYKKFRVPLSTYPPPPHWHFRPLLQYFLIYPTPVAQFTSKFQLNSKFTLCSVSMTRVWTVATGGSCSTKEPTLPPSNFNKTLIL